MNLIEDLTRRQPELQALRRDLHAHPELRFDEHRTAEVVARTLSGWGIEVHRGLGGTGVVGLIIGRGGGAVRSTTLTTSISRLRCLVICSMTSSEPTLTMVMRDSEASSVGATVSDSML